MDIYFCLGNPLSTSINLGKSGTSPQLDVYMYIIVYMYLNIIYIYMHTMYGVSKRIAKGSTHPHSSPLPLGASHLPPPPPPLSNSQLNSPDRPDVGGDQGVQRETLEQDLKSNGDRTCYLFAPGLSESNPMVILKAWVSPVPIALIFGFQHCKEEQKEWYEPFACQEECSSQKTGGYPLKLSPTLSSPCQKCV